jgi:hypothetical protein
VAGQWQCSCHLQDIVQTIAAILAGLEIRGQVTFVIVGQAGCLVQKMPNCQRRSAIHTLHDMHARKVHIGQDALHVLIEVYMPFINKLHDQGCGEHLGDTCDCKPGVGGGGPRTALEIQSTIAGGDPEDHSVGLGFRAFRVDQGLELLRKCHCSTPFIQESLDGRGITLEK